jgi:hypothetical protein
MRKFSLVSIFGTLLTAMALSVGGLAFADEPKKAAPKDVPAYLQDISVTIRASGEYSGGAEGSGVFKTTKDGQVWVWTCGHLIEHVRTIRKGDDEKPLVEFNDVKIIKVLQEDGRKVGEMNFDAEVIRYSDKEHGDDLALLRLRSKTYKPNASADFYLDKKIPAIGTKLMHCGSLLGQFGSTSVTNGIVSQTGRVLFNNVIFDQTNATCFPGSSGGIICREEDGKYVGMLVRGAGETFGLYVPVRRMQAWAKKVGVEFALDDSLPVPTDEELKKKAVDDSWKPVASPDKAAAAPHPHAKEFPTKDALSSQALQLIPKHYRQNPRFSVGFSSK